MTGAPARARDGAGTPAASGVLVVDKPEGPTSHDVVARIRRALDTRQVGHTGTLDPMATGVLALVVGRATRLAQFLSAREKQYVARILLGVATDTWDRTGTVLAEVKPGTTLPGAKEVADALRDHLGERAQVPPTFSAKKVGGVRAYELARRGRTAEMTSVVVSLHAAEILRFDPPLVDLRLTCSSGFYVRALAESLGRRLGCGACLQALRRTASGSFGLEQATPLAELEERPGLAAARLVPAERALPNLPAVTLTVDGVKRALHGNDVAPGHWIVPSEGAKREEGETLEPALRGPLLAEFVRLLAPDGGLVAVARPAGSGVLHPVVVLG